MLITASVNIIREIKKRKTYCVIFISQLRVTIKKAKYNTNPLRGDIFLSILESIWRRKLILAGIFNEYGLFKGRLRHLTLVNIGAKDIFKSAPQNVQEFDLNAPVQLKGAR